MKFGAENSKKTIAAGILFLLAIVMFIRMLAGSFQSSTSAAPPTSRIATLAPSPAPARPDTRRLIRKRAHNAADGTATPVTPSLDPRLHLSELKQTEETPYEGNGRNIFMATEEPKIEIPKPVAPAIKAAQNTPPPPPQYVPPPINLKFFGFASGPDHKRVFLAQGDDVFVASEGDIVQRRYKIVKINNNNIEVLDVLSNNRQMIPLTAG